MEATINATQNIEAPNAVREELNAPNAMADLNLDETGAETIKGGAMADYLLKLNGLRAKQNS